jgi:hypothetical protein
MTIIIISNISKYDDYIFYVIYYWIVYIIKCDLSFSNDKYGEND